jgi:hypothetical protein
MRARLRKCPICESNSGYEESGILGKYAKCPKCLAKWKLYTENKEIANLGLHELPKNGSGLLKVGGVNAPLFTIIGKPLPVSFWKNLKLEEVDWDSLSRIVDLGIADSVMKEKGERVLYRWDGERTVIHVVIKQGNSLPESITTLGALVVTTRRLVWLERRTKGVWKQKVTSFVTVSETPLESIKGVSGDTGDSSDWDVVPTEVSVVDARGEQKFFLQNAFLELFKPLIELAVEMRNTEIEAEKKRERVHVMLDFSFLKTYMEKGGLVMQVLKCPECGGSVEFPKRGVETKCSHCGKTIYAQDIFEKVKGLL